MLCAPQDSLRAERSRDPHRGMRLLIWQGPWIHMTIVEVFSLVPPWSGAGPRLHDEVVRLFEIFAVISRIRVVEKLFAACASDPSGDKPATRDEIDLGQ